MKSLKNSNQSQCLLFQNRDRNWITGQMEAKFRHNSDMMLIKFHPIRERMGLKSPSSQRLTLRPDLLNKFLLPSVAHLFSKITKSYFSAHRLFSQAVVVSNLSEHRGSTVAINVSLISQFIS